MNTLLSAIFKFCTTKNLLNNLVGTFLMNDLYNKSWLENYFHQVYFTFSADSFRSH